MRTRTICKMLVLFTLVCSSSRLQGAQLLLFEDIENAPTATSNWFEVVEVSGDGGVVAAFSYSATTDSTSAWSWSHAGGFAELPDVWQPQGISAGGSRILLPDQVWEPVSGNVTEIEGTELLAISNDGTIVAGHDADLGAFLWSEEDGRESLGLSDEWIRQVPAAMSADGTTIAGSLFDESFRGPDGFLWPSDSDGFIWRNGTAIELELPHSIGHVGSSQVFDMSSDGNIVLAIAAHELQQFDSSGQLVRDIGGLEDFGDSETFRRAFMSSDGSVVVGDSTSILGDDGFPARSVMWDEAHGYRGFVEAIESDHGLTFPSQTRLVLPRAMSDDKTVIVGYRKETGNNNVLGWAAYLDRPIDSVPEPSSLVLISFSIVVLSALRRSRRTI